MAYKVAETKEEGRLQLAELVSLFEKNRPALMAPTYKETPLRSDFLDGFLMCLGWDVNNEKGKTQFLRDVVQEESIDVEDEVSKKSPDYTLRVNGIRKLFVEAKKPSVDVESSSTSAFQTRRYGWNANLGISILSNFDKLVVYDCRHKPSIDENVRVARVKVFTSADYLQRFDELYDMLSYSSVSSGALDELFSVSEQVGETFDLYFLSQIESWREKLSKSAVRENEQLSSGDINFLIQRLINRIVFLRICEDRAIEKYETIKAITDYESLKELFLKSDKKYNSGLFDFIEDNISLHIRIDSQILINVFQELYYPLSPYDFSVVDPAILSQIYEKFLGSRVTFGEDRIVSIEFEPEAVASNGVVPTPKFLVEQIITETIGPRIKGLSTSELKGLKVADICCGSGTFLISAFDFLIKATIERIINEGVFNNEVCYESEEGVYVLTLSAKREILEKNIFGVDINPYATEVTEFSLLLKLLEGETADSINHFVTRHGMKVLPNLSANIKCGNSLVGSEEFFAFMPEAIEKDEVLFRVKPFSWHTEFPFLGARGGFDAIVGNPPYVRIQNLKKYSPEEIKFYQSTASGYEVARNDSIDKYYVFIQRALGLLNDDGYLGYIVPHKFFINTGGKALRKYIRENASFVSIIHFGDTQVFPDRSTYTAILVLRRCEQDNFKFKRVHRMFPQLFEDESIMYSQDSFGEDPWIFLSTETASVFQRLQGGNVRPLGELGHLCVGVQTSNDKVYIFQVESETSDTYTFTKNGVQYSVEKDICRDCIYDVSLKLFETPSSNVKIIFPYSIDGNAAKVIAEDEMRQSYPRCWQYLSTFKSALEKRSITGTNPLWYQYGRSQSLTRFHEADKLLWPVLSTEAAYVYDQANLQFTGGGNGPYYALTNNSEYSLKYFMGILSNPIFEKFIKAGASEFRGAYYSHGKQFLKNVPIRIIDQSNKSEVKLYEEIISYVDKLIGVSTQLSTTHGPDKAVLRRKKDILYDGLIKAVNNLYGITEEDYNLIANDPMFNQDLTLDDN